VTELVAVVRQYRRDVLGQLSRSEAERLLGHLGGGSFLVDESGRLCLVLDDDIDWPPHPIPRGDRP
jgi:hypothetical protein